MPGCAVHTLLATRVLTRWNLGDATASPLPPDDSDCRAAFYAGSMGPDFGYYPGGDQLFAELAHYLQAVELTRALVRSAPDFRSRAFAWGWTTHVLADCWIHPVINREVARRFPRSEAGEVSYAEDPVAHIRVELGIDSAYARDAAVPARPWPASVVDRLGTDVLANAYDTSYGIRVDRDRLCATKRAALRLMPWMLAYERLIARGLRCDRPPRDVAGLLSRTAVWLLPRGSAAYGILRPVAPTPALLSELSGSSKCLSLYCEFN